MARYGSWPNRLFPRLVGSIEHACPSQLLVPHRSIPSLPRTRKDGHVMRSLAWLISRSVIVLAFNETLGWHVPIRERDGHELHDQ